MELNRHRLEFATTIFIRECIRQYMKLHPATPIEELPIKALVEYPPRQQAALMAAVGKAIEASNGMNDAYKVFIEQKLELAKAQPDQSHPTGI